MKLLIAIVAIAVVALFADVTASKKSALYVVEAEWGYHDNGFISLKACDPPAPKDSAFSCGERSKSYVFTCPDNAIGVLPPEAVKYNFYGIGHDNTTHPVVYCIMLDALK